jgi:phage terminase large subunit-like protein
MVFLFGDSGVYRVLAKFYLPARNIEYLERKHKVPYMAWSRMKMLTLTDGNVVDYEAIRKDLVKLAEDYDIRSVVIDRKFQGQQLEGELIDDGFSVFAAGYGWKSQDVALKEIERCVRARRLLHDGHPVLRWHASNAVVETDKNENYSLSKRKSRSKIDGMAALCNAMQAALRRDESMGTIEVRSI